MYVEQLITGHLGLHHGLDDVTVSRVGDGGHAHSEVLAESSSQGSTVAIVMVHTYFACNTNIHYRGALEIKSGIRPDFRKMSRPVSGRTFD